MCIEAEGQGNIGPRSYLSGKSVSKSLVALECAQGGHCATWSCETSAMSDMPPDMRSDILLSMYKIGNYCSSPLWPESDPLETTNNAYITRHMIRQRHRDTICCTAENSCIKLS
jgi:hypothetical protein